MENSYEISNQEPRQANITVVTILSLCIPGLGQLITGQVGKGLAMLALGIVLFMVSPPLILLIDFFAAWDVYSSMKKMEENLKKESDALSKAEDQYISADALVEKIKKINNLARANILTAEELCERKGEAIRLIESKQPTSSIEDFLTSLIPLLQSGDLSSEEIDRIKTILIR